MPEGREPRMKAVRNPDASKSTDFLDHLASQLKIGRHAAYRRAVQRISEIIKRNYKSGEYSSTTEAEYAFRKLLDQEGDAE